MIASLVGCIKIECREVQGKGPSSREDGGLVSERDRS